MALSVSILALTLHTNAASDCSDTKPIELTHTENDAQRGRQGQGAGLKGALPPDVL